MPYIYNSTILGASTPDSTASIPLCPVNRYMRPWGSDLGVSTQSANNSRHTVANHIEYIAFKPASDMTMDRFAIRYIAANGTTDTWNYKVALYSSTDGYPDSKLTEFGTISIVPASTTPGALEITGLSQALTGNTLYWIAIGVQASGSTDQSLGLTPFVGLLNGDFANFRRRGMASPAAGVDGITWLEQVSSYSGTLPTSTTFASNTASGPLAIRPMIRRSA
jgi:hypothetical protein